MRVSDIAADIAVANVDKNVGRQQRIFRADTGWPLHQFYFRQLSQRNHGSSHGRHQHLRGDGLRIAAQFARIADGDIKTLTAFHRGGNDGSAQCHRNNFEQITDRQTVTRQGQAIRFDIQVIAASDAFGIRAGGARHLFHHGFDLPSDSFDFIQIVAKHLDADGCADAGGQHIRTVFDRHGPSIRDPGDLQCLIEFDNQFVDGHAGAPFMFRFQVNDGFSHFQRRRVSGGIGTPRLAENRGHFGKTFNDFILRLHRFCRFSHRNSRQRDRHVQQCAFVQRRHEFRSQLHRWISGKAQHNQRNHNDRFFPAHHPGHNGLIPSNHQAPQRIICFTWNMAADQQQNQHRNQRNRQDRRACHGKRFGVSQRLEHPPFLRFQRKYWKKRHGNN